jgi:hypothetical protein
MNPAVEMRWKIRTAGGSGDIFAIDICTVIVV